MLTDSEMVEIQEELKSSKRPIIFFDDDTDGLCAFLLFYRYAKEYAEDVRGIPIKDSPELRSDIFLRKIDEFQADKVFILDKPLVHQDFLDRIKQKVIWLDHHPMVERTNVKYYNPLRHKSKEYVPDNRPTTYWAYRIVGDDNNMWIAMAGCVSDWFVPEFTKEFAKNNPDFIDPKLKIKNPGTLLYNTKLGRLCRIMQFNMKCPAYESVKVMKILSRIQDPREIVDQTSSQGRYIVKNQEEINNVYERVKSEIKPSKDKILFYIYNEKFAMTSDLSTELQHSYPNKVVLICREKGDEMVCSIRSQKINIADALKKSLVGIRGHGGGHNHAVGAGIYKEDFQLFLENFRKNIVSLDKKTRKTAKK